MSNRDLLKRNCDIIILKIYLLPNLVLRFEKRRFAASLDFFPNGEYSIAFFLFELILGTKLKLKNNSTNTGA
jgi:hypothetical protein